MFLSCEGEVFQRDYEKFASLFFHVLAMRLSNFICLLVPFSGLLPLQKQNQESRSHGLVFSSCKKNEDSTLSKLIVIIL